MNDVKTVVVLNEGSKLFVCIDQEMLEERIYSAAESDCNFIMIPVLIPKPKKGDSSWLFSSSDKSVALHRRNVLVNIKRILYFYNKI